MGDSLGVKLPAFSGSQLSPRGAAAAKNMTSQMDFEETMRDEVVQQLRKQLEDERKRHREMKEIFDETMQNIEEQNRYSIPAQALEMQTNRAIDEIISKGAVT